MMTNMFSIFDPSSAIQLLKINWIAMITPLIMMPNLFWKSNSTTNFPLKYLIKQIINEMKMLLNKKSQMPSLIMISMMIFIMVNNALGLLPFVFTSTSHLMITLSISLPLWTGFMIFSIMNNTSQVLAHMLPLNSPPLLMPFMIMVETLSNLIRPFTLAIRLSANMIAGHLLILLMSNSIQIMSPFISLSIILSQVLLMILETAVSIIQAYVFTILCILYISET